MLYGHPELTNDRKVPKAIEDRLERSFPMIKAAWHNEWGCWILLQQPIESGAPWDFLLVCQNPATSAPKEIGPWIFMWLEVNRAGTATLEADLVKHQREATIARAQARADWRRSEVSEPIARAMRPDLFRRRESFAGVDAASIAKKRLPKNFKTLTSGLVIPGSA